MNTSPNGHSQRFGRSVAASERLNHLVPGGAHTYSKGDDDQYPDGVAPVIFHGSDDHVWDVDGNRYLEYGSGLRAVVLDHGRREVVAAPRRQLERGTNFVRPNIVEQPSLVVSTALTDDDIDRTIDVVADACVIYREALDAGDPTPWLEGRPIKPVFRTFA
jgi:4-aminobutyrate aminotransferase-like enzyme